MQKLALADRQTDRQTGIDFVKGVCIILVVMVHTLGFSVFPAVISAFFSGIFLNCFFVVSGYLISAKEDFGSTFVNSLIIKKLKSLSVTYFTFGFIVTVFHIVICVGFHNAYVSDRYFGWDVVKRDIFCIFSGLGVGTLWFLPVLFIGYCVGIIIRKLFSKWIFLSGGLVFCAMVLERAISHVTIDTSTLIGKIMDEYRTMLCRVLLAIAYTIIGILVYEIHKKTILFVTINMLMIVVGSYTYSMNEHMFNIALSVIFLSLSVYLFENNVSSGILTKVATPVVFCGRNSLIIMIYHYLFLLPIQKAFFSGGVLFIINLFSSMLVVLMVQNNSVHKRLLGKL